VAHWLARSFGRAVGVGAVQKVRRFEMWFAGNN
jgi:hypothetical protein